MPLPWEPWVNGAVQQAMGLALIVLGWIIGSIGIAGIIGPAIRSHQGDSWRDRW